jgi:enolase
MSSIKDIEARKILDSRGIETVEVKISTDSGIIVTDSVPSGTSTGSSEATVVEPTIAVNNVNNIIGPKLIGLNPAEQSKIDQIMLELDGTPDKSKLGANSILGVSLAVSRAAAGIARMPLYLYLNDLFNQVSGLQVKPAIPTPMMVMIEGGKHTQETQNCIQEFLCISSLENGGKIWNRLKKNLTRDNLGVKVGLEGGFAPQLEYDEDAIRLIMDAANDEGLLVPQDVKIGLDIAD